MTKEHLLSKTIYGVDIIQHHIRKEFPDYIMQIKGDDCGKTPTTSMQTAESSKSP